jgi:hypothetical protein
MSSVDFGEDAFVDEFVSGFAAEHEFELDFSVHVVEHLFDAVGVEPYFGCCVLETFANIVGPNSVGGSFVPGLEAFATDVNGLCEFPFNSFAVFTVSAAKR